MMGNIRWERLAAIVICGAASGVLLYLAFRYALPLLLPFLVAWLFSLAVRPMAERISKQFRIPKKPCAVVLLIVILGGTGLLFCLGVGRLVAELQHLLERMLADGGSLSGVVRDSMDLFETLTSRIGFLRRIGAGERFSSFREQFNDMVADMVGSLLNSLSAGIPRFAGKVIASLPNLLLISVVTVISGFYFCIDGERISASLISLLPQKIQRALPAWKARIKSVSWRYLRAYLWLLLLTFFELLIGFLILGIDYAFLLALVVAVVDMLPVLGVGTVLVPWAAVLLFQGNYFLGFGLLILYFAMLVLRQITEPKLVGKSLGLHPLLTLFASWAGWQLLGILGMVLGPFLALAIKTFVAQVSQQKTQISDDLSPKR